MKALRTKTAAVHIRWGREVERGPEIRAIAEWLKRSQREIDSAGHDLLALGDWNIERLTDENHDALTSTGLAVPPELDPPPPQPAASVPTTASRVSATSVRRMGNLLGCADCW